MNNSHLMDFNYKISRFFLDNNRLTILCFGLLLLLGIAATMILKTTGFPNPDIKFAQVSTLYVGASSETVAKEISAPLEAAVKDVEGVLTVTSQSANSFSYIGVQIDESSDTNTVLSKIDSAIQSINLPAGAEDPELSVPSIAGPDFLFSLVSNNKGELYESFSEIESDLLDLPETSKVEALVELKKTVLITIDQEKLRTVGLDVSLIQNALASLGETIPVVSDVTLDSKSKSIATSLEEVTLEDLKKLKFGNFKLEDFASVKIHYEFLNSANPKIALNIADDPYVFTALTFQIKAKSGTDLGNYEEKISEIFESYEDIIFVKDNKFEEGFAKVLLLEDYSINNDNERQVEEVVSGLIGSKLKIDGPLAYAGWLLGAIQLVFLVMVAFVSFRAAIIAALAIPLSMVFSTIYIYFVGEQLNTLVLFSLVLAIGLVVDPALVLLESIQRKIDIGLSGKEASLAAVKDVGMGLFLACLTSLIVFLPFGVVSGILGQIITYIPLTIIPAVVGSYIVPLIFLAWLGGLFLRKKRSGDSEEENLWLIAKWTKSINEWILSGSRIIRFIIIAIALLVPLFVTAYFFQTGKVRQVQFASSDNYEFLQLSYVFFQETSKEEREKLEKDLFKVVVSNQAVESLFPFPGQNAYFVQLKPAEERGDYLSIDAADDINKEIKDKFENKFFDITLGVISNGPPGASYQVTIAVKTNDLDKLKASSLKVAATLAQVCLKNAAYIIDKECEDGEKVVTKTDNGYSGQENRIVEVILDREKLKEKQLLIPNAPITLYVNLALRNLFGINDGNSVGKISIDGEEIDIVLDKKSADPKKLEEVKNMVIMTFAGEALRLSDIADIKSKETQGGIQRVNGETVVVVKGRVIAGKEDAGNSALIAQAVLDYYEANPIKDVTVEQYSEGDSAGFLKSFTELFTALALAIIFTYIVLVVFFESFTQPLVILFAVPLTFLGVFPALAYFGGGQFGFLEIIGLIILVGIVENVAIFLIDAARQKIREEGWDDIRAISYASAIRFRAVILTKLTAIASLAPLAILSEQYRSISIVIMAGLLTSGVTSLFTTPILFVFFRWLSREYRALAWYHKILFFPLFPLYILVMGFRA